MRAQLHPELGPYVPELEFAMSFWPLLRPLGPLVPVTFVKICPNPGGGENTLRQNIGPNGVSLVGIYQKCVGIEGCEGFDVVI